MTLNGAKGAVLAAAMVALAGCGSSGGTTPGGEPAGSGTGEPTHAAGKAPSCDLAPAGLVNSLLGTNVGEPTVQNLSKIVVCRYSPVSGSGSVVVRMQTDMSRSVFDQSRSFSDANGLPTADLPGFKDAAFTSVLKAGSITTNTVAALQGTVSILVSSPASFEAEKALESQLFDQLV